MSQEGKIGNSGSPAVILRAAEKEIQNKNFQQGIDLLEDCITRFPAYPSFYFLLGKAYAAEGNYRSALQNFKKGSELIRSEKTYQFYLKEIEKMKRVHEEKEKPVSSQDKSDYSDLLENSPRSYSPPKKDFEDNLVSETLAKIFLSQGETDEAVKIYEKLMKKYPLKQLYFEKIINDIRSGRQD